MSSLVPEMAQIPPANFLGIAGSGEPGKFLDYAAQLRKVMNSLGIPPGPLEALWWSANGGEMQPEHMEEWRWQVMLKLPHEISSADLARAKAASGLPHNQTEAITLTEYNEGTVVQLHYVGSLKVKAPEMAKMADFTTQNGYEYHGKYHEIYLNDPGPGSPPNAVTILRQQVRKAGLS